MLTRSLTAGALALVLMPAAAWAETVDVTPAVFYGLDLVEALVGLAISAGLGWLAMIVRPFVGERIASSAAEKLERAGRRAVTAARMRYLDRKWTVEIENEIVADVVGYLGSQLPEAISTVGLTPEGLRRFAARLLGEEVANLPHTSRPEGYTGKGGLT